MRDPEVTLIANELRDRYHAHTVILYGSRARGEETSASDYDILGVAPVAEMRRDARRWKNGTFLDAFIYPETKLERRDESHLYMRDGIVIFEKNGFGQSFLKALSEIYARGPKALAADEREVRLAWYEKTLERIRRNDPEAHFRRAMTLTNLLEDYFVLRGQWYEGPRRSIAWLRANDGDFFRAYERALSPASSGSELEECYRAFLSGLNL